MAKNTVNGKKANKGELIQIKNFLYNFLPKLTVDLFLKALDPCCKPVILSASSTCVGGGLYNIDLTFNVGDVTHVGGLFINVKGDNGNLYIMNCERVNGVVSCTGENIPLQEGTQYIQILIFYAPLVGQGDPENEFNGMLVGSTSFPVEVLPCP